MPNAVPISLGNTHLLPLGVMPTSGSGNPRTITGLFPYADGYQTWAGACSDADPQGVSPSGQRVLRRRDPLRRDRHDAGPEQHAARSNCPPSKSRSRRVAS